MLFGLVCFALVLGLVEGALAAPPPVLKAGASPPRSSQIEYVPGEIIVKFKPVVGTHARAAINSEYGTSVLPTTQYANFELLAIPQGKTVPEMVERYSGNAAVEYAQPNWIRHLHWAPNDPAYSYQWHLDNDDYGGINMEQAWDVEPGGDPSVIVAVIDTGVAYEDYGPYCQAPDLAQTNFVPGYDFANNDSHANDDDGHGTHVAGTIAQSTNNGVGVAGVAFNCSIMPVKVFDENGDTTDAWVAQGINFAWQNGADVINLSLGGPGESPALESACADAYNHGVVLVASAGNEGDAGNEPHYPAAYDDYVIAVGATRYDETRSYYSNTGSYLDIAAPGGDMTVDQNGDGYPDGVLQNTFSDGYCDFAYRFLQGTSMAAPHVSGVAALLISHGTATNPDDVRQALQSTAEDHGTPGWDEEYGWGIVDAYAALMGTPSDDHPNSPPGTHIEVNQVIPGNIETGGDVDFFNFNAWAGSTYVIETTLGSLPNTYLYLYDSDGSTPIASDDNGGPGLASRIEWICPSSGTYFIKVRAYSGTQTGTYTLIDTTPLVHAFYGNVTIGGEPAPVGTVIEARGTNVITVIEGNPITTTEVGKYGSPDPSGPKLLVQGDIQEGEVIEFYVSGVKADQTFPFASGEVTHLNLTTAISRTHIDANPFLFVYKGVTSDLPEALTNIGPEGLHLVIIVWSTVEGEWVSFHPHTGAGFLRELVNGRPYVMPVTEDGVCNDWYWPSD